MARRDGYFFEDQLYPEQDPMTAARAMGLPIGQAMMGGGMSPDYDLNALAEMLGITYNPSQGYPNKIVPDQVMDVYGPTPDYLVAQQFGMMTPNREDFSLDAFFGADPMLRGPAAQALAQSKGDTIGAYDYINSPDMQDQLRQQIGRTEWDQLAGRGDLRSLAAITGEEKDEAAMEFYMRGLEGLLAGGAPTSQRNMQQYDAIAERMGGRPYPGAGTTPYDDSGYQDALADLAGPSRPETADIEDIGESERGEGMGLNEGQAFADIGGRRYAIADPVSRRAVQQVSLDRRERLGLIGEEARNRQQGGGGDDLSGFEELKRALVRPPWQTLARGAKKLGGGDESRRAQGTTQRRLPASRR